VTHYVAKHAKVVPFHKTTTFKAFVFATVTPAAAGVAATGGAVATHHPGGLTAPGTYYGVPAYDHSDPYHSDPGGEWIRIEASPIIGTASTNHQVIVPNG
jgi:hypothetical protein